MQFVFRWSRSVVTPARGFCLGVPRLVLSDSLSLRLSMACLVYVCLSRGTQHRHGTMLEVWVCSGNCERFVSTITQFQPLSLSLSRGTEHKRKCSKCSFGRKLCNFAIFNRLAVQPLFVYRSSHLVVSIGRKVVRGSTNGHFKSP